MSNSCSIMQRINQLLRERSFEGYLILKYRFMRQRVKGKCTKSPKYFIGVPLCSKDEFIEWSKYNDDYKTIYLQWLKSGFNQKLCPVPDRINASLGYTINNMRWVTNSKNAMNANMKMRKRIAESSNSRKLDFDSRNAGASPASASK